MPPAPEVLLRHSARLHDFGVCLVPGDCPPDRLIFFLRDHPDDAVDIKGVMPRKVLPFIVRSISEG